MKALYEPLNKSEIYSRIKEWQQKGEMPVEISGTDEVSRAYLMNGLSDAGQCRLVITYSEQRAEQLYEDLRFYQREVYIYPSKDILFYSADIHGNSITRRRMEIYKKLLRHERCTIILKVDALFDKLPDMAYLKKNIITMKTADEVDIDKLKKRLVELGYEKTDSVDGVGQFAIRGGIIDIFPLTEECPYRIDLWDTEIDTIKSFDVESQRSIEVVDSIDIYPASEMVLSKRRISTGIAKIDKEYQLRYEELRKTFQTEQAARLTHQIEALKNQLVEFNAMAGVDSFIDYFYSSTVSLTDCLPRETVVMLDEPCKISELATAYEDEFINSMNSRLEAGYILPSQMKLLYSFDVLVEKIRGFQMFSFSLLPKENPYFSCAHSTELLFKSVTSYKNRFDTLVSEIKKWREKAYRVILIVPSATRGKRLADNLMDNDVSCFYSDNHDRALSPGEVMVTFGRMRSGFECQELHLAVISEGDIFSRRSDGKRKRKSGQQPKGEVIKSFEDISVGDYVIHERYGIGIFRGIEKVEVDKVYKDYVTIEYAQGGKLYVLASEVDVIQKYSDKEGKTPKINKLGDGDWDKVRRRVKGHVKNIAKELVELYAKRQASEGFVYSKDTIWQQEFEETFPYEETEDQKKAIAETKADMESTKIMDRLLCGDVGFGKTEVAIRAAFKAVCDSKQVAYLVPTTVLAEQHYNTFKERMKDFPVEIRLLCRFCTPKEIRQTLKDLQSGAVDIVIGTHRLLSKDVVFKNLGLLIIDEEQRFGVTHKEKIKQMKSNIDVLTLTATPIPRTLHMSLIGIRDMSVLEEPPVDRRAIQTYVMEMDPEFVKEAITRELKRKGQVYYVYNRVQNIEQIAAMLSQLVPEAAIEYAHGQMNVRELEDIMSRFINREIDVLVTTTIIETGLDIPNANTMIIHDADKFGLAQLYQLRGRVGRSDRNAYAFLMYRRDKLIKETAEKRLKAIREFTDLGSGIKVAMKDLEIRGVGNILGADQSGHMEAVGYDLYCKMLNDAIREQKGEHVEESFDTTIRLPFDAFIPAEYVKNEFIKLDLYKRISHITGEEDYEDLIDEITDRFGELPEPLMNLLDVSLIKARANRAYITSIDLNGMELGFTMYQNGRIDTDKIDDMLQKYRGAMKLRVAKTPAFVLKMKTLTSKEVWSKVNQVVDDIAGLVISTDTGKEEKKKENEE